MHSRMLCESSCSDVWQIKTCLDSLIELPESLLLAVVLILLLLLLFLLFNSRNSCRWFEDRYSFRSIPLAGNIKRKAR